MSKTVKRCGRTLPSSDWTILAQSPIVTFLLIASADGKIDRKELREFAKIVEFPGAFKNTHFREALQDIYANFERLYTDTLATVRDPSKFLGYVVVVLDTWFTKEEALDFKRHLMMVGLLTAQASGGGIMGLKNPVSEVEAAGLFGLMMELGLSQGDFKIATA